MKIIEKNVEWMKIPTSNYIECLHHNLFLALDQFKILKDKILEYVIYYAFINNSLWKEILNSDTQ
jgi:hypothetical protein